MNKNRYAALRVSGSFLMPWVKRLYCEMFLRPYRARLGEGTYIDRPFWCSSPNRMEIGARVIIRSDAKFTLLTGYFEQVFDPRLKIGADVYIGAYCEIVCIESVVIGNRCTLSDYVYINDSSHSLDPRAGLMMDRPLVAGGPIVLEDGCFVGYGATLLPGVTIGTDSVVGARAVVTRSVPPRAMVLGNPARVIARFDETLGAWVD